MNESTDSPANANDFRDNVFQTRTTIRRALGTVGALLSPQRIPLEYANLSKYNGTKVRFHKAGTTNLPQSCQCIPELGFPRHICAQLEPSLFGFPPHVRVAMGPDVPLLNVLYIFNSDTEILCKETYFSLDAEKYFFHSLVICRYRFLLFLSVCFKTMVVLNKDESAQNESLF